MGGSMDHAQTPGIAHRAPFFAETLGVPQLAQAGSWLTPNQAVHCWVLLFQLRLRQTPGSTRTSQAPPRWEGQGAACPAHRYTHAPGPQPLPSMPRAPPSLACLLVSCLFSGHFC